MTDLVPNTVISKDGMHGTLVEGMPADTSHVFVAFENGKHVLVPVDALTLQANGRYYYLGLRLDELEQHGESAQLVDQPLVVPVIEEVLDIERRRVEVGRVRVQKHVYERTEMVDEPLLHDEVTVTRVPVNRFIEQPIGVHQEGDTLIVPVLEEVLVVEKRLLLKEELHITRRIMERREPQEVTLRREEVTVKRVIPDDQGADGGPDPAH